MKLRRIRAVALCEARQLRRDPMLPIRALGVPITLMLLFGYGITFDVEQLPTAVIDHDRSATSREYIQAFTGNRSFDLVRAAASEDELEDLLRQGQLRLALVIPPGFEREVFRSRPASVQILIDGVYPYRADITRGYALTAHAHVAEAILKERLEARLGAAPELRPIEVRTRYLYNEDLRSANAVVPGVIPVVLMMTPAVMMAVAIVREKELGSIFNFLASPATRAEFVLGKLVPYVAISLWNAILLAAMAVVVFDVHFKGSPLLYLVSSAIYVTATASIGLLVSAFSRSQIAATIGTFVLTLLPSFLYSGVLMPIANMEPTGRVMAHLFPGMYQNKIVIGAFLKNLPMSAFTNELLILLLFAATTLGAGILLMRKR
ncbi:MAG: ABC transporter permease [Deltaproteobacteria bacterium]|nr:ABC transporter permease [Deltaproteobacteria bacterium]